MAIESTEGGQAQAILASKTPDFNARGAKEQQQVALLASVR